MNYDITFCNNADCKHTECKRNQANLYLAGSYYTGSPVWFADFKDCEYWKENKE